jgi:hypothetical protein
MSLLFYPKFSNFSVPPYLLRGNQKRSGLRDLPNNKKNSLRMENSMNNKRAGVSVAQILLLCLSVFAFAFVFSEGMIVSAETRQLLEGRPIEVTLQSDGTWTDSYGIIYVENEDGRLVERESVPVNALPAGVSSTQMPTNTPTAVGSSTSPPGGYPGSGGVSGGQGQSGQGLAGVAGSMGQMGGLLKGSLGEALIWGGVVFGGAMAVASVLGGKQEMVEAVAISAGIGAFTAKFIEGQFETGPLVTVGIGAAVGLAVFMLIYKETKYEAVTFDCLPWQAPVGASKSVCEICNDESMPCSDYRCKSLGQTCELVNEGTNDEMCVNVNPKDVTPPVITPDSAELTQGYKYDNVRLSPPGPGFDVVRMDSENVCIEAFTPLRFGITTDEPAQCRIDFNSTSSFDSMYSYMGGSNLFQYKHYEQFVLPYAEDFGNTSYQLRNGKDITFFIRCQDKNGNTNEAEYAINFCVDPSPDTTVPQIKLTSMDNEGCIPATTDSAAVEFYTNEPAQCRWSRDDQVYDLMDGDMVCANKIFEMNAMQLYTCRANLTGVTKELTDFYVRCQDLQHKPVNDRNTNQQSYRFSLRGSNMLKMRNMEPNGTIYGGINPMPVDLRVETLFGCERGKANCYFSGNGIDGDYVLFATTNMEDGIHNQTLYLPGGNHEYFIKCVDSGGNLLINSTKFELDIDTTSPIIARIYNDLGQLKIVTLRDSECTYSYDNCDFLFEEGLIMPKDATKIHFANWDNEKTYHIKCRDKFRDLTADCSAIVKPTKLSYKE